MMDTTKQQDAWHKACRRVGNDNMLSIGTWVAAYVDERLAAKPQPAEPRADDPLMPNWFCEGYAADDGAIFLWRKVIAELTRRVAEAVADKDREISELQAALRAANHVIEVGVKCDAAAVEQIDALKQQLAASQAEVERLKRDASVAEDIATIANQHGWNGVDNSKFLSVFIEDALNDHRRLRDEKRKDVEQLLDENKKLREENARLSRPVEGVKELRELALCEWETTSACLETILDERILPRLCVERNAREAAETERDELRAAWRKFKAWPMFDGKYTGLTRPHGHQAVKGRFDDPNDAVLAAYRAEKAKVGT